MATLSAHSAAADFYNAHIRALAAEAGRISLAGHTPAPEGVEQRHACIDNPLCGDQIEARIQVRDGRIIDLGFEIRGCLLAEASAVVMRQLAVGETLDALEQHIGRLEAFLDGEGPLPDAWAGALECFTPVQPHPGRHDCLLLPFLALQVAQPQL